MPYAGPRGKHQKPMAILADLQGPKIRTGALEGGKPVRLRFGQQLMITTRNDRRKRRRREHHFRALPESVHKGDRILLCDGRNRAARGFDARA